MNKIEYTTSSFHHAKWNYTCRIHTQHISQKYNRNMIEFILDNFSSSFNDRNKHGFPLIIEIKHDVNEDNKYRSSDDDASLDYSISPQLDDEDTVFESFSVATDHICPVEDEDNISYGTNLLASTHTSLDAAGCYSEYDSISRSDSYSDLHDDNSTFMEDFSTMSDPIYQIKNKKNVPHEKNVININNSKHQVEGKCQFKSSVSYEKQSDLNRSNTFVALRQRLREHERSSRAKNKNKEYNKTEREPSSILSPSTASTKSSSGDEGCIECMEENMLIDKLSNFRNNTTGEDLSIDPSTADQTSQKSRALIDDLSYSIYNNCELDLNRYKHQIQSSQASASLAQSSVYIPDNAHLKELRARKRKLEKKFQAPPRLVITKGEI